MIKNGAFACYSKDSKTAYWSTKTGREDGYPYSGDDLSVAITGDGKLDARFLYSIRLLIFVVEGC
jgi:hypothetical protein